MCADVYIHKCEMIGGPSMIEKTDKCKFGKRKYNIDK